MAPRNCVRYKCLHHQAEANRVSEGMGKQVTGANVQTKTLAVC